MEHGTVTKLNKISGHHLFQNQNNQPTFAVSKLKTMGTSNFHYRNTSKCYAVLMNDEDGNPAQDYEIDDLKYNVYEDVKETSLKFIGLPNNIGVYFDVNNKTRVDALRGYPAFPIVGVRKWLQLDSPQKYEDEAYATLTFICVIRSGYYEGGCLDYDVKVEVDGYETELGMIKSEWRTIIEAEIKRVGNQLEQIFERYSIPLTRVGTFSNGETIYTRG
jgi:hypothetical protein